MKRSTKLTDLTTEQLVALYVELGLGQNSAEKSGKTPLFNRLAKRTFEIVQELQRRPGDERITLLQLYDHPDMQVRYNAARDTWFVANVNARQKLEEIRDSKWYPQAAYAGMQISILDGKYEKKSGGG